MKILFFILFPIIAFGQQCPNITFIKNGGTQGQYQLSFDLTGLGWSNCNGTQLQIVYDFPVTGCDDEKWQSLPQAENCESGKQRFDYTGCRNSYCVDKDGNLLEVISFTIEQSNPYQSLTCVYNIDYSNASTDSKDSDYCKYYEEIGLGFDNFSFDLFYGFRKDSNTYLFLNSSGGNIGKMIYVEKSKNGWNFEKVGKFIIMKDEQYWIDMDDDGNSYYRLLYIGDDLKIYSNVYYIASNKKSLSIMNNLVLDDGKLYMKNNIGIDYQMEVMIFDDISRVMYVIDMNVSSDSEIIQLDISKLKRGMYIIQYKFMGLIVIDKIVVSK